MEEGQTELLGHRCEDTEEVWGFGPGAYRKTSVVPAGEPESAACICWYVMCPGGCGNGMMLGPKPPASGHFVKEEADGSMTCELHPPEDPENSNSTLCPICGWHGQCVKGLWKTV